MKPAVAILAAGVLSCHGGEPGPGEGAACASADGCRRPLACELGACRPRCSGDADCPGGACLTSDADPSLLVCTVAAEQICPVVACPRGLVCGGDGICRNACDASHPCDRARECVDGACFER